MQVLMVAGGSVYGVRLLVSASLHPICHSSVWLVDADESFVAHQRVVWAAALVTIAAQTA